MKMLKILGAALLLFALLHNPMSASAEALTGQQRNVVGILNPSLANNTNWQIAGSGLNATLVLYENNITYVVNLNGVSAEWATFNGNNHTSYVWTFYLGDWTYQGSEPYGPPQMPCGI